MAERISLRVQVAPIEVEVNDNGDTILLPVNDERFLQKIYDFAVNVSNRANELAKMNEEDLCDSIKKDVEFHEWLKEQFDGLFGENAYRKVYGDDIVVGAEYVLEFLDLVMPIIQKHSEKRADKFNKYSANRIGSSL